MKPAINQYAVYFHCQTNLVETFRELYPTELSYSGNRAIILNADKAIPEPELRHCVALALTYTSEKAQERTGQIASAVIAIAPCAMRGASR